MERPSSAAPGNTHSMSESVTGVSVSHNPSIVVQNLNEMLAAYRLGN